MSKINHMKKVVEYLNVFRKDFEVRQEFSDEIQITSSFLKMSFKFPSKIIYLVKKVRKIILIKRGWTKTIACYESYGGKNR